MRIPRPFAVYISGAFAFTVHAPSLAQAQAIVSARLADLTGVTVRAARKGQQR